MRILRLFALAAGLSPVLAAAQGVVQVATLPTPMNLSGVWFKGNGEGWIAGDAHAFFRTTDFGQTWAPVAIPGFQSEPFYDVYFATPQLGFLSGNSGELQQDFFRTTDGGATWQLIPNFPVGGSYRHIDFVSPTIGFMGANGALVRTTDAGLTWPVQSSYPDCPIMYGMDFFDASTGLAAGYQISSQLGGIFKTTDGGQTWALKHAGNVNKALFLSSSVAIAVDGTDVIRSNNGGETWATIGFLSNGSGDLANPAGNVIVSVDLGGSVYRSADGGVTWSRRVQGIGDLPGMWRVRFWDASNGAVVGTGGSILSTNDGGMTWTYLSRGYGTEWYGLLAFNDANVLAIGLHGYAMTSSDQGLHWQTQLLDPPSFGRDTAFSDVARLGPTSAYAVGHWGSMFKTSDSGATWTNLSFSVNQNYYANGVAFTDANNGWVVGFDYNTGPKTYVRQTHDGGLSWQGASLNVPSLDVAMVGQTGYVLTTSQPLYKTTDGGLTWTGSLITTPTGNATSNMAMSWWNASLGYVAGFEGFLAKTTDGGATWNRVRPEQASYVYLDVLALSATEVWATAASQGGGNAVILRSMDGGATWQSWSLPGDYIVASRLSATPNFVYASGSQGHVWKVARSAFVQFSPNSFSLFRGVVGSGGLNDLLASDDSYLVLRQGIVLNASEAPVSLVVDGVAPFGTPSDLRLLVESHTTVAGLTETIELWDYQASAWVLVSTSSSTLTDTVVTGIGPNPQRFVQGGTNAVRARVSWKSTSPFATSRWMVFVDQVAWRANP